MIIRMPFHLLTLVFVLFITLSTTSLMASQCGNQPFNSNTLLKYYEPGTNRTLFGHWYFQGRTRNCDPVTGCTDWAGSFELGTTCSGSNTIFWSEFAHDGYLASSINNKNEIYLKMVLDKKNDPDGAYGYVLPGVWKIGTSTSLTPPQFIPLTRPPYQCTLAPTSKVDTAMSDDCTAVKVLQKVLRPDGSGKWREVEAVFEGHFNDPKPSRFKVRNP